MAAPCLHRLQCRVVSREIVIWYWWVHSFSYISEVFVGKCIGVVFTVTGYEELAKLATFDKVDSGDRGFAQYRKLWICQNVLFAHLGVTAMRYIEGVVKAAEEWVQVDTHTVWENTRHFLFKRIFWNFVMIVKSCLCCPTHIQSGKNMSFAPFHDFAKLGPVVDFFKRHCLDRCACDYHSVEALVFNIIEAFVKFEQVFLRGVLRCVGSGLHELDIHLKRGVAYKTQELGFGFDFFWHEVQNEYFKRADVLCYGALFGHNKDFFRFQYFLCGERRRDVNWHWCQPPIQTAFNTAKDYVFNFTAKLFSLQYINRRISLSFFKYESCNLS